MTKEEVQNQWLTRLDEFKASGLSQTAWCKENNINLRTFSHWVTKSKKSTKQTNKQTSKQSNWIALKASEIELKPKKSLLSLKIGHTTIELNSDFDPELLSGVLKVLYSLC